MCITKDFIVRLKKIACFWVFFFFFFFFVCFFVFVFLLLFFCCCFCWGFLFFILCFDGTLYQFCMPTILQKSFLNNLMTVTSQLDSLKILKKE